MRRPPLMSDFVTTIAVVNPFDSNHEQTVQFVDLYAYKEAVDNYYQEVVNSKQLILPFSRYCNSIPYPKKESYIKIASIQNPFLLEDLRRFTFIDNEQWKKDTERFFVERDKKLELFKANLKDSLNHTLIRNVDFNNVWEISIKETLYHVMYQHALIFYNAHQFLYS